MLDMAKPNPLINTILYALLGGVAISLLTAVFSSFIFMVPVFEWFDNQSIWIWLVFSFLIPGLVIFVLLSIAFKSFSKLNISHLYDLVPDLNAQNTAKDFEGLSEQISLLTDVK